MAISFFHSRRWRIIRFYCVGWTFAFIFLSIVRGVGTMELGTLQFDFKSSMMIAVTLGPLMGFVSGFAQILVEERIYKYISIQRLLLLRFLYSLLFLILLTLLAYGVYELYFGTSIHFWTFAFDTGSGAIYFYVLFVDFFLSALQQISLMLGGTNLWKLMRGKFYSPNEEERIFMFLDLQSSTKLAEKLGHLDYSRFIQDCFNDLGMAIVNNKAEIYQYVGDEAVLTWPLKDGIKKSHCLEAFFSFKRALKNKEGYYLKKYGVQPFFKAGMHGGTVTVTEVGKYKKEIAYHGDTLNTAARIQGQCNALGSELLLSEAMKTQLQVNGYNFESKGNVPLKGKEEKVAIYAVVPSTA
ncbi:adenylate/guanylate cyclase domain-containing protein [Muricauda sp. JGD-17]|uniref:Adenylate/guanylate cyclase domain-containing protein n=1 Tax=Flagellimonas ochracea TaxID=2696472 RepID=A0A964WXU6_9FLAO|nr:adenylate/guanylate cyclase domain-containing protein [Allomuricauda ochracea]NAY92227.1 adenylate/guanylate cyclase domain-containing protein [Allomuricauda ochracea]